MCNCNSNFVQEDIIVFRTDTQICIFNKNDVHYVTNNISNELCTIEIVTDSRGTFIVNFEDEELMMEKYWDLMDALSIGRTTIDATTI